MNTKTIRTALLGTMIATLSGPSMAEEESPTPPKVTTFDQLFTKETPVIAKRGVHMHLTGLPPTGERFVQLLKIFAAARYNVVVIILLQCQVLVLAQGGRLCYFLPDHTEIPALP